MLPQKKIKILISGFLLSAGSLLYAQSVGDMFLKMPDKLIPILSAQQRFELLEYAKANRKDSVKNNFGTYTRIVLCDTVNRRIVVKPTALSSIELKSFYISENENITGVIRTVNSPVPVSVIAFYDRNWAISDLKFEYPPLNIWLNSNKLNAANTDPENIRKLLNNDFVSLSFDNDGAIVAQNNILSCLSIEDRKMIEPYINKNTVKYIVRTKQWVNSENN
jgi:hypothetical protein